MIENIVKIILNEYNGEIKQLLIPSEKTNGTGLCNPSILLKMIKSTFNIETRRIYIISF